MFWLLIKSLTVLTLCRLRTFFEVGITLLTLFERTVSGFNWCRWSNYSKPSCWMFYDRVHDIIVHCNGFESIKLSGVPRLMVFTLRIQLGTLRGLRLKHQSSFFKYKKTMSNIQAPPVGLLWSLLMFDPIWRPEWCCPWEIFLAHFVTHCESYAQDIENAVLVIKVLLLSFLRDWNTVLPHLYFSLIIVKSLQLCKRRQIAEPHKYCLVCVIVFL